MIYSDPLIRLEAIELLAEPAQNPPYTALAASVEPPTAPDMLSRLPAELLAAIAMQLQTLDFLNARLALRGFALLFYSQQFWASRFLAGGERWWLFEARDGPANGIRVDWRSLYHETSDPKLGPYLRNRKRIMQLTDRLQQVLSLENIEPVPLSSPFAAEDTATEACKWAQAGGRLWGVGLAGGPFQSLSNEDCRRTHPFQSFLMEGCRRTHSQTVALPQSLCSVCVSFVNIGKSSYISGITLTSADGEAVHLGYRSSRTSTFESSELSELLGFNICVGSRGIQSIQCVVERGSTSEWLGRPGDDSSKTTILALTTRVLQLKVGFDVSRK